MQDAVRASAGATGSRKRITKACDQCNASRSKCDGSSPCSRCRAGTGECTYNRQSRRHGRVARAVSHSTAVERRQPLRAYSGNTADNAMDLDSGEPSNEARHPPQHTLPEATTSPGWTSVNMSYPVPTNATSSAWFGPGPYGPFAEPYDWLDDAWLQPYGDVNEYQQGPAQSHARSRGETPRSAQQSGRGNTINGAGPASIGRQPSRSGSNITEVPATRYPVLDALLPYISRILSPNLACDLLESYVADVAERVCVPSSPLLLAHIFRRESLLSVTRPRPCTPALLASMLLVSAHTTEYPFFGSSPSARMRLYQQLLQLTLDLLEGTARQSAVRQRRLHALNTRLYRSAANGVLHSDAVNGPLPSDHRRARTAYIDDIVTYMHVALVTTTAESKPAGSRWWHTAFQLAREFKLNRDACSPVNSPQTNGGDRHMHGPAADDPVSTNNEGHMSSGAASPMSVSDDAIVEHSDPRPLTASFEEREERRRVWWSLYIWDRQLALRYNSPLVIKDAESQDILTPMDDELWQLSAQEACTPQTQDHETSGRARGPPTIWTGHGIFDMLLPLMCILGQIVDLHHLAYHPRVERSSNMVADAYVSAIKQQLMDLEPSIATSETANEASATLLQPGGHHLIQHRRLLARYARFLLHLFHALVGGQWDKLSILEQNWATFSSQQFQDALGHSVTAARVLKDVLYIDTDLGFKAMFFGIFLYHAASLPWAAAAKSKQKTPTEALEACDILVRAFEVTNCTYFSEYLVSSSLVMRQEAVDQQFPNSVP